MKHNIRIVSTYPPRRCGIGTFARDLAGALEHFTGEAGTIRVTAIDREGLPYNIPVDLVIDQYDPQSWRYAIDDIIARAGDMIGEVADLLLRGDEADWALSYGVSCQKILLSIRTSQSRKRAEQVIRSIVSRVGTGGGHETIAGGQIPLVKGTKVELRRLEGLIRKRFLRSVGTAKSSGRRLVNSQT